MQPVFFILHTAFFGLHYLFASQTAHIGALYAAFLAMMLASGEERSNAVAGCQHKHPLLLLDEGAAAPAGSLRCVTLTGCQTSNLHACLGHRHPRSAIAAG